MPQPRLPEECRYALLPSDLNRDSQLWQSPESDEAGLTSASSLSPEPPLPGPAVALAAAANVRQPQHHHRQQYQQHHRQPHHHHHQHQHQHQQHRHRLHGVSAHHGHYSNLQPQPCSASPPASSATSPDLPVAWPSPDDAGSRHPGHFDSGRVSDGSLAFGLSPNLSLLPVRSSKQPDLLGDLGNCHDDEELEQHFMSQSQQQWSNQASNSDNLSDFQNFAHQYGFPADATQMQYFQQPQPFWWSTGAEQLLPHEPLPVYYQATAEVDPAHGPVPPVKAVGPVRIRKRRQSSKQSDTSPISPDAAVTAWKGRSGPLDESTREKSRSLRQYGACWRCRKYRKPCSNGPEICETCVTSGFRVWPSTLGCRRGNLELYVDILLPSNAEFVFQSSPLGQNKRQPWRQLVDAETLAAAKNATALTTSDRRWGDLMHKVLGTRIFAREFVELFEIVATFQQSASREHPALDAVCTMLDATLDFYYTSVHIEGDETLLNDPIRTIRTIRKSFSRALRLVLNGCLSGRANEWLPCLLTSCLLTASIVCFTDASFSIPADIRQAVWSDLGGTVNNLKGELRGTIVHLLSALAKGGKPLKMGCWRIEETTDPSTGETKRKRNANGLKLLGNDEHSFDAVAALQLWLERHGQVVNLGRVWTSSQPFSQAQLPAIATMGALFDA